MTLEQTLSSILQSLADFFGVTTQTILENAPMWLAKYGWYITIKDIGINAFLGVFVSWIFILALYLAMYGMAELEYKKWHMSLFIIIVILVFCITVGIPIITCSIAPEYVGIEALFTLVNQN